MGLFGTGAGCICGVAAAPAAADMKSQVRAALRETPTVELRLDWLRNDFERSKLIFWLKHQKVQSATFIATCRRRSAGGLFRGSVQQELHWLAEARKAGCRWCDLEIETFKELQGLSLQEYGIPARVLLSVHDFKRTPRRFSKMSRYFSADAVKIAANSQTLSDSVRLLQLANRSGRVVAVPMGEIGLPGRILALRTGSQLAYAPIGAQTAPGQISMSEMKYLYRAHQLTKSTKVYGVIGNPIAHSLSPLLHNTGYAARQLNAVYLPFLVKDLPDFLRAIPDFGVCGFSVTLPHKQTILKYLQACEPLAADIGAVNTVTVRRDGSLYGCNTDYAGVLRALNKNLKISGSRILIFGAGGSARAAAFALARAGASIVICARREKAAKELARAVTGEVIPRSALRSESFDAILNATPVGMFPHHAISPLQPHELHCRIVMDLIYRPMRTKLLKIAAHQGIATVSGVEMFLAQGFAQWDCWMKVRAPESAMKQAVLKALRAKESTPDQPRKTGQLRDPQ